VMEAAQAVVFAVGMAVLVVMVGMSRVTGRWFPEMWELQWWGRADGSYPGAGNLLKILNVLSLLSLLNLLNLLKLVNLLNPLQACHAAGSIRLPHGSQIRTTSRSTAGDRGACDSLWAHVARGGLALDA
jgi:hypothetical protein